jgi:hypothetical protein
MSKLLSKIKSLCYLARAYRTGEVELYDGEFGYEMTLHLPLAYYLYKRGRLKKTHGLKGTRSLYFFSPEHIEITGRKRVGRPYPGLNPYPHGKKMHYFMWAPPPLRNHYRNELFRFEKPLWIVHNKYTEEWGGPPVNYLSRETLDHLFTILKRHCTVLYIRPVNLGEMMDHQDAADLNEFAMIKRAHPEVMLFQHLQEKHRDLDYNQLQFGLHASAVGCVSVQGGNSIVASYFGVPNFILAKRGSEITTEAFRHFYSRFSNAAVFYTASEENLLDRVQAHLNSSHC